MNDYITRNGYLEEVWKVKYVIKGFAVCIFIRGTEPEMHDYLNSEMGYVGSYHACSASEFDAITDLQLPIYLASRS